MREMFCFNKVALLMSLLAAATAKVKERNIGHCLGPSNIQCMYDKRSTSYTIYHQGTH